MQSKPRVRESNALRQRTRVDTDAIVLYRDGESVALDASGDRQLAAERLVCQSVDDCVFDEGLQQKVRHGDVERIIGDVHLHTKPVAEPPLLDLQIGAKESKLVAQRNVAPAGVAQRLDEQGAQVAECASRGSRRRDTRAVR